MKPSLILLSLLAAGLMLVGCDQAGKQRMNVAKAFPDCLIWPVQVSNGTTCDEYMVRKPDGSVWLVNCNDAFSFQVSSSSMIFPPLRVDDPSPR